MRKKDRVGGALAVRIHGRQAVEERGVKKFGRRAAKAEGRERRKTARSYEATAGVKFFEVVEQCGRWPQRTCTTIFS